MPTVNSGFRRISDNVHTIKECIVKAPLENPSRGMRNWYDVGSPLHGCQTAYLIEGDRTLLFDTLSPNCRDGILENLDALLDDGLDYLVLSHPEANHAGNAMAILRDYPEAELIAPANGSHHDLFGFGDDVRLVEAGDVIDLGGPSVEFIDPLFVDHAIHTWMFETTEEILFPVDWMGHEHMEGDCLAFADELTHPVHPHQLNRHGGYAFVWYRFVDPEKTDRAIEGLIDEVRPSMIAPAHGQVVREDPVGLMRTMKSVIREISEQPDYHLHTHQIERSDTRAAEGS